MTHPSQAPFIASAPPLRKAGVAGEQGKFTPDRYGEGMCLCKRPAQPGSHCQGLQRHGQLHPAGHGSLRSAHVSADPSCKAVPTHAHHGVTALLRPSRQRVPFSDVAGACLHLWRRPILGSLPARQDEPALPRAPEPASTSCCQSFSQEKLKNTKRKLFVGQTVCTLRH